MGWLVPMNSPAGTAESYPGHRPGLAAPNHEQSISEAEVPQDCILGICSRPYGTQSGEACSHADPEARTLLESELFRSLPGVTCVFLFLLCSGHIPRHQGCGITRWVHREISSSARFRVRGPIHPITAITISIAAAMNTNTPVVPKFFSTPAMTNEVKIAEKRLQE
jgi:hypothetical protein